MGETILVVDDVRMNRLLVGSILKSDGYRVVEAENGEEALLEIRRRRPALVLLDIVMPVMDGIECCRAIKSASPLRSLKVVMVTSENERGRVQAAFDAGCDGYLLKPVSRERLLAKVRQQLRLSATHRELDQVIGA